jgi:hypothetical protein
MAATTDTRRCGVTAGRNPYRPTRGAGCETAIIRCKLAFPAKQACDTARSARRSRPPWTNGGSPCADQRLSLCARGRRPFSPTSFPSRPALTARRRLASPAGTGPGQRWVNTTSGNSRKRRASRDRRNRRLAGETRTAAKPRKPTETFAMQKVEGSNPISRSENPRNRGGFSLPNLSIG